MQPRPGRYRARASDAKLGEAKTGTPQVGMLFAIIDPATEQETGEFIVGYVFLSDKAFDRGIKSLRYCGWEGDDLSDLSTVGSKDCEIEVVEEEYSGRVEAKVSWINALGTGGVAMAKVMDPSAAKSFAAKMRGMVVAASGGKPAPKAAAAKAPPKAAPRAAANRAPAPAQKTPDGPAGSDDPQDQLGW